MEVKCANPKCENEVIPAKNNPHKRFCSRKCSQIWHNEKTKQKVREAKSDKKCIKCGVTFFPDRSDKVYCSEVCGKNHRSNIRRRRNLDKVRKISRDSAKRKYHDNPIKPRQRSLEYARKNPQKRQKLYSEYTRKLPDALIKNYINRHSNTKHKHIPKELIELKRTHIQLKRKLYGKEQTTQSVSTSS